MGNQGSLRSMRNDSGHIVAKIAANPSAPNSREVYGKGRINQVLTNKEKEKLYAGEFLHTGIRYIF